MRANLEEALLKEIHSTFGETLPSLTYLEDQLHMIIKDDLFAQHRMILEAAIRLARSQEHQFNLSSQPKWDSRQ